MNDIKKADRAKYEEWRQIIAIARLLTAAGYGKIFFSPERIDKEKKA